jgi:uncharacterized membrane protein
MTPSPPRPGRATLFKVIVLIATSLMLTVWLFNTPPGLLGKADAVGYAVCHRIPERSFMLGERPISLCARCTGMYSGALLGLLYQARRGRRGGMPSRKILIVLGLFFVAFGVDGVNSYVGFIPQIPRLYESQNYLRLITGTGLGLGIAAMVFPVFHQAAWERWLKQPALQSWRDIGELILLSGVLILIFLSENPLLLYPLALLSTATILVVLTMVYTMVWLMLLKRENQYTTWKDLWPFLMAGFCTALVQIAAMDAVRYSLTHSWNGFFQ